MLSILGNPQRVCQGWTRREMLKAGAGLLGVGLPQVLAAQQFPSALPARAKSVLFLYIYGGPSQLETFDLKPDAPSTIRGPFKPTPSRTPGLLVSEHLPKMAAMSDKFCVVRTMTHTHNNHHACHWIQTGRPWHFPETVLNASERDWPAMGSIVDYLDQRRAAGKPPEFPAYAYVPAPLGHLQGYDYPGQYAGWLGRTYNALATNFRRKDSKDNPYFRPCSDEELDFRIQGLALPQELTLDRLDRRQGLLSQFDAGLKELEAIPSVHTHDRLRERALALVHSDKVRNALDLRQEPANLRDRYGRHLFGQATLLGRRMIEAGSRFVTVQWEAPDGYSWDSHLHSRDVKDYLSPALDQAYSALIADMSDRGLLDETLVVLISEMGRTPTANADWGRGHWCHVFPAILAGGGIRGGIVYGASDKHAGYPQDLPTSPADLSATIFSTLGIDPDLTIQDPQGRPVPLVDGGKPLTAILA